MYIQYCPKKKKKYHEPWKNITLQEYSYLWVNLFSDTLRNIKEGNLAVRHAVMTLINIVNIPWNDSWTPDSCLNTLPYWHVRVYQQTGGKRIPSSLLQHLYFNGVNRPCSLNLTVAAKRVPVTKYIKFSIYTLWWLLLCLSVCLQWSSFMCITLFIVLHSV